MAAVLAVCCVRGGPCRPLIWGGGGRGYPVGVGLYTILPSLIWHGVWHTKGGSLGRRILRNGRAIVFQ